MTIPRVIGALGTVCVLAAAAACGRVESDGTRPRPIEAVAPSYPFKAWFSGASGEATVRARIGQSGNVQAVTILRASSNMGTVVTDSLSAAASAAAREWRFEPQSQEGNVEITFSFRMMSRNTPEDEITTHFMSPFRIEVRGRPVSAEPIRDPPGVR
jgi:TonB family protein